MRRDAEPGWAIWSLSSTAAAASLRSTVFLPLPADLNPIKKTHSWPAWMKGYSTAIVPNLFGTDTGGRQFFRRLEGEWVVSERFRFIIFLVHFISNLMPLQIWQEIQVHGSEVGDPSLLHFF